MGPRYDEYPSQLRLLGALRAPVLPPAISRTSPVNLSWPCIRPKKLRAAESAVRSVYFVALTPKSEAGRGVQKNSFGAVTLLRSARSTAATHIQRGCRPPRSCLFGASVTPGRGSFFSDTPALRYSVCVRACGMVHSADPSHGQQRRP